MNFQKFVHRSTKGLFLAIAIVMIVPLVLWGYGSFGNDPGDKDAEEEAGTIFGRISISRSVFNQQKFRAYPSYYLKLYRQNPRMAFMLLQGMRLPEPKEEEIAKLAWRNIVLLQDARNNGFPAATEAEVKRKSGEIIGRTFFGRVQMTLENEEAIARQAFHATKTVYADWIADLVLIDKLLETMAGSEFADYDKIYDRVMGDQQSVRVTFAGFDPKEYAKEAKPARTEEIAKYYQDNKAKFKTPEKVVVAYLMADTDELKKSAPEPTEDEIKKYYDDHKLEFQKPAEHKHAPGEEHKEDEKLPQAEPKPFAEVRGEIPDKIKKKWADDKAGEVVGAMNTELGKAFLANEKKFPESIFSTLQETFERTHSLKLVNDLTTPFDRRRVEEIEKVVGTGGGLESWSFDAKRETGEISQIVSTTKGKGFFRLLKKIPANENPGVTAQNREAIVKELQKEQIKKRAQQQASAVVEEIKAHGMAGARGKHPVEWRTTRYFKTEFSREEPEGGDPGIEDKALGSAIRSRVGQSKVKAGEAMVLQGSMAGREKQDWSYVIYVDDVVSTPPADFDARFQSARRELDSDAREKFQTVYGDRVVLMAEVKPKDPIKKDSPGDASVPSLPFPDDSH